MGGRTPLGRHHLHQPPAGQGRWRKRPEEMLADAGARGRPGSKLGAIPDRDRAGADPHLSRKQEDQAGWPCRPSPVPSLTTAPHTHQGSGSEPLASRLLQLHTGSRPTSEDPGPLLLDFPAAGPLTWDSPDGEGETSTRRRGVRLGATATTPHTCGSGREEERATSASPVLERSQRGCSPAAQGGPVDGPTSQSSVTQPSSYLRFLIQKTPHSCQINKT